jgi:hypothetical protein
MVSSEPCSVQRTAGFAILRNYPATELPHLRNVLTKYRVLLFF